MPGLTLPQNAKVCWQVQAREQWNKKFGALWDIVVVRLLLSSTVVVITLSLQGQLGRINTNALCFLSGI